MFLKSRREKKENDRLASDEDLDGMFQPPAMSNNGNLLYEHQNKPYWDQAEQNHRNSIISIGNDYPRQAPEINNNFISRVKDSENHEISESVPEDNSSVPQGIGALGEPGAALVGVNLIRQGTMGSTSTSPLIQNSSTGNFVRVRTPILI